MPAANQERPAVVVEGWKQLNVALAHAEKQTRLGVRAGLREVAEPVKHDAEVLTGSQIRNMRRSPKWMKMRVGITRTLVYVAPRQRGTKILARRRRNLAPLMMTRAMEPALKRHEQQLVHEFEQMLGTMADDFNHPTGAAL